MVAEVEQQARQQLDKLAADLRQQRRNQVHVQAVCTCGNVLEEIGRGAHARHADLLVLGAWGKLPAAGWCWAPRPSGCSGARGAPSLRFT